MNCVWKLNGLPPGLAGGTASTAVVSDILLDGRRGEAAKSGLRKPLLRDEVRSSMSFQLLLLLLLL